MRPPLTAWLCCAVLSVAACQPGQATPGHGGAPAPSSPATAESIPSAAGTTSDMTTGTTTGATALATTTSSAPQAGPPPGPPQNFSPRPASVGRLLLTTLEGAASGVAMRVWVWLPPEYDHPAYANTHFPVLVLYPGGDGVDYTQWFSPEKLGIVASGAASGKISPFIIVEPQLQPSIQLDTECTDLAGQPKVGTFMETDVPAMVKANFRVLGARTGWGVGGVSSGAYCASRLLFARPDVYSVGASLGGYFTIDSRLPAGRTPAARATSPQVIAAANAPDVRIALWTGAADKNSLRENQGFVKVVRAPTSADLHVIEQGTHTWTTFQQVLPDVFAFFTANLDKPAASGGAVR